MPAGGRFHGDQVRNFCLNTPFQTKIIWTDWHSRRRGTLRQKVRGDAGGTARGASSLQGISPRRATAPPFPPARPHLRAALRRVSVGRDTIDAQTMPADNMTCRGRCPHSKASFRAFSSAPSTTSSASSHAANSDQERVDDIWSTSFRVSRIDTHRGVSSSIMPRRRSSVMARLTVSTAIPI